MMPQLEAKIIPFGKAVENLRSGIDESKCRWVTFPNNKRYLLPIQIRQQRLSPVFDQENNVTLTILDEDEVLSGLVDQFNKIGTVSEKQSDGTGQITMALNAYSDVIKLLRHLLLKNYDFTNEDVKHVLTLTAPEFNALFNALIEHLRTP